MICFHRLTFSVLLSNEFVTGLSSHMIDSESFYETFGRPKLRDFFKLFSKKTFSLEETFKTFSPLSGNSKDLEEELVTNLLMQNRYINNKQIRTNATELRKTLQKCLRLMEFDDHFRALHWLFKTYKNFENKAFSEDYSSSFHVIMVPYQTLYLRSLSLIGFFNLLEVE